MRGIRECLQSYIPENGETLEIEEFNVRESGTLPDLSFDIYFSSGGPGSPLETGSIWTGRWNDWFHSLIDYNRDAVEKKNLLLVGLSFQMACRQLKLAKVCKRKSPSFGVFPVSQTSSAHGDELFKGLPNPFYVVDDRSWQVIQPSEAKLLALEGSILALEKERPHVPLERAVMGIRFSNEIIGFQFHPEADPKGMRYYLNDPKKKEYIISKYGLEKYEQMVLGMSNKNKIQKTFTCLIPNFLNMAIGKRLQFL